MLPQAVSQIRCDAGIERAICAFQNIKVMHSVNQTGWASSIIIANNGLLRPTDAEIAELFVFL